MNSNCYIYDEETCIFMGTEKAQESPREQGQYLLPPCSTLTQPLPYKEGFYIIYDTSNDSWHYKKDERYYINLCHDERIWRNTELYKTDIFMISDYPISFVNRFKVKSYRKKLRNWPDHPKFPDSEYRPKPPSLIV